MGFANLLSRLAVTTIALGAGATLPVCVGHAAEPANVPFERTITVSGEGQAKAVPNQAHLSAGVVSQGRKAADALSANTRAMNGVFAALRRLGIPDKSIQTSDFSITPQYQADRNGSTSAKIVGLPDFERSPSRGGRSGQFGARSRCPRLFRVQLDRQH